MKKIFLFLLIFLFFPQSSYAILKVTKLPYKDAQIERIYKLDDSKYIFIEQWGRGDVIWEYDPLKDKFREISKVWTFIELEYHRLILSTHLDTLSEMEGCFS